GTASSVAWVGPTHTSRIVKISVESSRDRSKREIPLRAVKLGAKPSCSNMMPELQAAGLAEMQFETRLATTAESKGPETRHQRTRTESLNCSATRSAACSG